MRLESKRSRAGAKRTDWIAVLAVSCALAWPGPSILAESARSVSSAGQMMDLWIDQQMEYRGVPGLAVAVLAEGEVVWSNGYGFADLETRRPMTTATPFRVGSISKLVTSTLALVLRDEGELGLDDGAAVYLSGFPSGPESASPEATVRDLLLHTSGLPREAPFPYWTDHVFPDRSALLASLAATELRSDPGAEYRYSNFGMGLLGELVSIAGDAPLEELAADRLFRPLGMKRSTYAPTAEQVDGLAVGYMRRRSDGTRGLFEYYDTGALAGAANVVSTIDDLARFAAFHLAEDSGRVLSASSRREMQRVHFLRPGWESGRGLGFAVAPLGESTAVSHGGWIAGHRTHFLLVPESGIAVVAVVNCDDGEPYRFARAAYDTFAPVLESEPPPAKSHPRDWSSYLGVYADPWEWEYRVLDLDGDLVLYGYDYPPAEAPTDGFSRLERVGPDRFRMPDGDPVVFEFDESGAVSRVQRRTNFLFPVRRDGDLSEAKP